MNSRSLGVFAICGLIATMLAACGGGSGSLPISSETSILPQHGGSNPCDDPKGWEKLYHFHNEFEYKGKVQEWSVPTHLTQALIVANGAAGGGHGSPGACIAATLAVTGGFVYDVYVGGWGSNGKHDGCYQTGGFDGGGEGGTGAHQDNCGFGGGGASDVRSPFGSYLGRMIVAGGGGGQGEPYVVGGDGGYPTGQSGGKSCWSSSGNSECAYGGGGGTQSSGGAGGAGAGTLSNCDGVDGTDGGEGPGGSGGSGTHASGSGFCGFGGGGGGGGYYGGGGGGGGLGGGGGGGGGSSAILSGYYAPIYSGLNKTGDDGTVYIMWSPKKKH